MNGTIHGVEMSHDEFLEEFVEFIEAKGWNFIGHTQRLTEGEAMKHTRNYLLDHDLSKDPNDEE
ncbi:hypothetical protein N781_17220 [Pontibacillus halophilus JSM 076056 = DSM 19796]|uniref:Uncharacterized protein n=1 Tax=Pontibacillus halophilus JSM 076056 = DSM 19796 TaxID=1385510 RepID=A0A0A5GMS2_9BACI|nr:hypothetical protein N781_17220 [Pontibacillus halophilus JSM 076056 = DSM 19796]